MADDELLTLRATGPATNGGRIPLAELGRIATEFQDAIERIALALSGLALVAGPRPRRIVDAVGMELRALTSGSAVLTVDRSSAEPLLGDDLLLGSLDTLESGLAAIAQGLPAPEPFTAPVLDGLLRLSGGVADGTITGLDIQRGGRTTVRFDKDLHGRIRAARIAATESDRVIVGRLRMGDVSPGRYRCRVDTITGNVACTFTEELKTSVLAAMDALVRVRGQAIVRPGGRIQSLDILEIEQLPGSPARTLDELAAEQRIQPQGSLADHVVAEPLTDEEYADFLAAAMSARGGQQSP